MFLLIDFSIIDGEADLSKKHVSIFVGKMSLLTRPKNVTFLGDKRTSPKMVVGFLLDIVTFLKIMEIVDLFAEMF